MDPARLRMTLRVASSWPALLGATTLLVAILEGLLGVDNAAMTYLLAVIGSATLLGWRAAAATAVGAFLIYDVLFIEPRFTLTVDETREWLTLLLLLVVGVVVGVAVGRAAGAGRDGHVPVNGRRVRCTRSAGCWRHAHDTRSVLPELEAILARETDSSRAAIVVASGGGKDRRAGRRRLSETAACRSARVCCDGRRPASVRNGSGCISRR